MRWMPFGSIVTVDPVGSDSSSSMMPGIDATPSSSISVRCGTTVEHAVAVMPSIRSSGASRFSTVR